MWRLWLSGLFCLPALIIVFQQRSSDSVPNARAAVGPPASVVALNGSAPTMHLSLPVELLIEPAVPDPDLRNSTGPSVAIPLREVMSQMAAIAPPVALTSSRPTADSDRVVQPRRAKSHSGHRDPAVEIASRTEPRAGTTGSLSAFIARNLTLRAFALPDQNGGG